MIDDRVALYGDRPAFIAALAAADLPSPIIGALGMRAPDELLMKPRAQDREGGLLVVALRAFGLATHDEAARNVADLDGAIGLLQMLSAASGRATGRDYELVRIEPRQLDLARLVEDRDGYRAGLDAPALVVRRNALPTVTAGFIRERFANALARCAQDRKASPLVDELEAKATSGSRA